MPGNTDLGTRLVWTELQVERVRDVPGHGSDTPHGAVADQIATTASTLDHVQNRIVELATSLSSDLQRVAAGHDANLPVTNGILRTSGLDIDLLVTRRTELHQSLTALIDVYKTLPAFVPTPEPTPTRATETTSRTRSNQPSQGALTARQKTALQAIGDGSVTIYRGLASSRLRVLAPGTVSVATVNELIDKKLVGSYPAEGQHEGHKLDLTPTGQTQYEALLAAGGRAAAARTRPTGNVGEATPELAGTGVAVSPPRSRSRG
ncbi:hypothetical protein ACIPLC_15745 [Kitasatospora sp. NPDC086801]|uniref:hypothetical protein n=1 Tax=unclassified Kitasatospora TaxID=2633591 RepID=UPI00382C8A61